jgi:hypothetical protein
MVYKIFNCNPGKRKGIARPNPTTPHSRYPSGGPGKPEKAKTPALGFWL